VAAPAGLAGPADPADEAKKITLEKKSFFLKNSHPKRFCMVRLEIRWQVGPNR
jgi:hypothetical protein